MRPVGGADAAPDGEDARRPPQHGYGAPDGTTPIDGATKRINHQYFSRTTPPTDTFGTRQPADSFAPQKFYELDMKEDFIQLHPDYAPRPVLLRSTTQGMRRPGPLIQAKYGEPVLVRFKNHLPSVKTPQDFGIAEMTTHLHNGHTPSESDGNPVNYFNSINDPNAVNPHGFKDQHYPNVLAGFTDPTFGPAGNPNEALGSLWYHDHHLDFTAQNVYKGMFGCYNLFDDMDTGVPGTGLDLPYGRDLRRCPIFFHDALFDKNCQTVFDLFDLDGILGDRFLANGAIQPFLNVKKRALPVPALCARPVALVGMVAVGRHAILAVLADRHRRQPAAERRAGDQRAYRRGRAGRHHRRLQQVQGGVQRLYFVNRAEQVNGRGPTGNVADPRHAGAAGQHLTGEGAISRLISADPRSAGRRSPPTSA